MESVVTSEFICSLPSSLPEMARIAKERQVSIAREREATLRRVRRRFDTPEALAFWKHVDETAAEVATWPAWKRVQAAIAVNYEP